jgi:hypothetical protein
MGMIGAMVKAARRAKPAPAASAATTRAENTTASFIDDKF